METFDISSILKIIADHSIWGAGITAALAFGYKLLRILKTDIKSDNFEEFEKNLREELRDEIKLLKEEVKEKTKEVDECVENCLNCQKRCEYLKITIEWMKTHLNYCQDHHSETCPLLLHIGQKQFDKLTKAGIDE